VKGVCQDERTTILKTILKYTALQNDRARASEEGRPLLRLVLGLGATDPGDAKVFGPDTAAPRQLTQGLGLGTQSPVGKALPNVASVVTSGEDDVCLNDGVPGGGEAGSTGLQLHPFNQEVGEQRVTVLGHKTRSGCGSTGNEGRVDGQIVVVGLGRVDGREECLGEPVLGNETLLDDEQHFGPDLSDGMDSLSSRTSLAFGLG